jgi:hypothetical protein
LPQRSARNGAGHFPYFVPPSQADQTQGLTWADCIPRLLGVNSEAMKTGTKDYGPETIQKSETRSQNAEVPRKGIEGSRERGIQWRTPDSPESRDQIPEFRIAGGTGIHLNAAVLNLGELGELGGCLGCERSAVAVLAGRSVVGNEVRA